MGWFQALSKFKLKLKASATALSDGHTESLSWSQSQENQYDPNSSWLPNHAVILIEFTMTLAAMTGFFTLVCALWWQLGGTGKTGAKAVIMITMCHQLEVVFFLLKWIRTQ